jgi:hypothetical protein
MAAWNFHADPCSPGNALVPDTCASIEGVQQFIESAGWRRIGIDGVTGAGKSYLADELSRALEVPVLDVDDYVHRNQGGYVDFVDYPALASALSSMPAFILCGACLRGILANLGTDLDGHVYVMRMREGLWADEDDCVFPDGVEAAIGDLVNHTAMLSRHLDEPSHHAGFAQDDDEAQHLKFEVMRYHAEFVPQDAADLVFERGKHND